MTKGFAIAWVASLVAFALLDFIWLSSTVNTVYRPRLGALLAESPVIWAVVLFYLLYGAGLAIFVIRPAMAEGSVVTALWMGAVFGLVAYGTYDLTNLATLKDWSVSLSVIDMAWGTILTGAAATIGVWIGQKFAG